jgi:hypothetical protein
MTPPSASLIASDLRDFRPNLARTRGRACRSGGCKVPARRVQGPCRRFAVETSFRQIPFSWPPISLPAFLASCSSLPPPPSILSTLVLKLPSTTPGVRSSLIAPPSAPCNQLTEVEANMTTHQRKISSPAWYSGSREEFLAAPRDVIANQLAGRAADESLEIESAQNEEWRQSVDLLQKTLDKRLPILREALMTAGGESIRHVILEYDFHRRGLRMDCLLLGDGVLFVVEFKRSKIQRADRDQVMTYAVNLLEFHRTTQELSEGPDGLIVVPVITLTGGAVTTPVSWPGLGGHSWPAMARKPLECDGRGLQDAIKLGLEHRRSHMAIPLEGWLNSPFRPLSAITQSAPPDNHLLGFKVHHLRM